MQEMKPMMMYHGSFRLTEAPTYARESRRIYTIEPSRENVWPPLATYSFIHTGSSTA